MAKGRIYSSLYFQVLVAIAIGLLMFGFKTYYATPKGRYFVDKQVLRAPIFGPLMRKIAVARFTRTMATLIASGVPILDCLEITASTAGNAIVEEAIMSVKKAIEEGRTIVEPLTQTLRAGKGVELVATFHQTRRGGRVEIGPERDDARRIHQNRTWPSTPLSDAARSIRPGCASRTSMPPGYCRSSCPGRRCPGRSRGSPGVRR